MSELIGTYRSDIQICSCGSHVFKLLKENGGYTTECRCGFACGPWCEDADSAIQQLINQAKESFQSGYIEVKEGICEDEDIFPAPLQNIEEGINALCSSLNEIVEKLQDPVVLKEIAYQLSDINRYGISVRVEKKGE
jgi:hypothetical protein